MNRVVMTALILFASAMCVVCCGGDDSTQSPLPDGSVGVDTSTADSGVGPDARICLFDDKASTFGNCIFGP